MLGLRKGVLIFVQRGQDNFGEPHQFAVQNGYLHNSDAFHIRGGAPDGDDPLGISDDDQPLPDDHPHLHQTPPLIRGGLVQQNSQPHIQQPDCSSKNEFHEFIELAIKIILLLQI